MFYDLRHALRALMRRPGLSLAVLLICPRDRIDDDDFSVTSSVR